MANMRLAQRGPKANCFAAALTAPPGVLLRRQVRWDQWAADGVRRPILDDRPAEVATTVR
jgi:hypothetical protein